MHRFIQQICRCFCIFLFLLMVGSQPSLAQNAINPNLSIDLIDPARELENRLEREKREEEIQKFRSTDEVEPNIINPERSDEGPCVNIFNIVIEGITLLPASDIQRVLEGRSSGCLHRFHISEIMRRLDKSYVDRGFITARTYIPKQDVQTSAVLKLVVVEGSVEDIVVTKNGTQLKNNDMEVRTIFPNATKNTFLNIRDFEQGLEQLNRQRSVNAKMRLEPGANSGGSIVHIEKAVKDRYRSYVGFDNLGSQATGERQLRVQLGADGILSANDIANFVYVGSTNANAVNGAFSIPVGYNTFTASASLSDYLLPLSDISELLSNTQVYTFSMDRVLKRNAKSISHLSAALRYRESERFINGIALTPQNTTVIDLRARHIVNKKNARWSYELGVRSGLPWFGGQTDLGPLESDVPHAEFQALDFAMTRIGKKQKQGRWTTSLRGQIARHALLGSEQFSLGAQSTVRGFRDPILGGDSGAALRVEGMMSLPKLTRLKSNLPMVIGKKYDELRKKSGLYVFTDIGGAYSFGLKEGRGAVGVGAGYRFFAKKAQFDIGLQSGLVNLAKGRLNEGDLRLTTSVTYKVF